MERLTRRERRQLEKEQRRREKKEKRGLGLTRVEANLSMRPTKTKQQKEAVKKIEKRANYRKLRSLGYSTDEAKRFSGASRETIEQLTTTLATPLTNKQLEKIEKDAEQKRKQREKEKKLLEDGTHLVVYWQDLIGHADQETVTTQRSQFRFMRIPTLERSAVGLSKLTFGESPASLTVVRTVADIHLTRVYYRARHYLTVYEGKGESYRNLLVAVNTMMVLLYDTAQKREFIRDLIDNLRSIHPKNAARLYRLGI